MNEKQIKILTTLVKVGGVLQAGAAKAEFMPEKYWWVGLIVAASASAMKDVIMWLGDKWDDGKINNSYKP